MITTREWILGAVAALLIAASINLDFGPDDIETAQAVAEDMAAFTDKEFCASMDRYPVRLKSGHLVCREMPGASI
ncbi:MAG: hypothetical protein EOO23_04585 [Comamonadaceae bacterium]|nr:MAG: hypothetical protein EOO23_04585 [Comamonadaceae bacterium]